MLVVELWKLIFPYPSGAAVFVPRYRLSQRTHDGIRVRDDIENEPDTLHLQIGGPCLLSLCKIVYEEEKDRLRGVTFRVTVAGSRPIHVSAKNRRGIHHLFPCGTGCCFDLMHDAWCTFVIGRPCSWQQVVCIEHQLNDWISISRIAHLLWWDALLKLETPLIDQGIDQERGMVGEMHDRIH